MDKDRDSAAEHENSLSASSLMDTSPQAQIQNRGHVARHSDNQRQIAYDWLAKWEPVNIWLVLIGIVATAAIFVLYGLTRSPVTWVDEVFYAEPARMLASSGSLSSPMFFDIAGLNHNFFLEPPVYFLLMAGVYRVFGFSETVARLGSAIPYIAGIVAGFFLARSLANRVGLGRLLSSVAGLLAAFLLAFNEMSRSMSQNGQGSHLHDPEGVIALRCCSSFSAGSVSPRLRMRQLIKLYGLVQVSCSCCSRLLHISLWADQPLGSSWP